MGISNLLLQLKSISDTVHLSDYAGMTAGIDAFGWLHRAAQSCPMELCRGEDTSRFLSFVISRLELLLSNEVKPLMVFDGSSVPVKRGKNSERREQREQALASAEDALARGDSTTARKHYGKAVSITHETAHQLIEVLRERKIPFLVAPYEADGQLAYLSRNGLIDLVITEDSDSLVFGCRRVMFKLDADGNGREIQLANLPANEDLSFVNWTPDMFLDMCLLAGCDYLPSIPGVGIKTAYQIVREQRTPNRILQHLVSSKFRVTAELIKMYFYARATFKHMRVYDPETREDVFLTPVPEIEVQRFDGDLSFLGPRMSADLIQRIANGLIHPTTHEEWARTPTQVSSRASDDALSSERASRVRQRAPFDSRDYTSSKVSDRLEVLHARKKQRRHDGSLQRAPMASTDAESHQPTSPEASLESHEARMMSVGNERLASPPREPPATRSCPRASPPDAMNLKCDDPLTKSARGFFSPSRVRGRPGIIRSAPNFDFDFIDQF